MKAICVLRDVSGIPQYVPLRETANLQPGEDAFMGEFASYKERDKSSPSGSHERTVCEPRGPLTRLKLATVGIVHGSEIENACILRNLGMHGEDWQYIDALTVPFTDDDTIVYAGRFRSFEGKFGPSGSDRRRCYLPAGRILTEPQAVAA